MTTLAALTLMIVPYFPDERRTPTPEESIATTVRQMPLVTRNVAPEPRRPTGMAEGAAPTHAGAASRRPRRVATVTGPLQTTTTVERKRRAGDDDADPVTVVTMCLQRLEISTTRIGC